jgi:hypothetical protein
MELEPTFVARGAQLLWCYSWRRDSMDDHASFFWMRYLDPRPIISQLVQSTPRVRCQVAKAGEPRYRRTSQSTVVV